MHFRRLQSIFHVWRASDAGVAALVLTISLRRISLADEYTLALPDLGTQFRALFTRETLAALGNQLSQLDLDVSQYLNGRSLDDLAPGEIYVLAKVLPGFTREKRYQIYTGVLKEALSQRNFRPSKSLKTFQSLRQGLGITDSEHDQILDRLRQENPDWFAPNRGQISDAEFTIRRNFNRHVLEAELTIRRPFRPVKTAAVAPQNPLVRQQTQSEIDPTIRRSRAERTRARVNKRERK